MYSWSPPSAVGASMPPSAHLQTHILGHMQLLPHNIIASPYMWTKEDVRSWLKFCSEEFSIENVRPERFDMNGKALCLLNRSDFMERDPSSGDVLYNALQRLLQAKHDLSSLRPPFTGAGRLSPGYPHSLTPAHGFKAHVPVAQNGIILFTGQGSSFANTPDIVTGTGSAVDRACADGVASTLVGSTYVPILPQPAVSVAAPRMSQSPGTLSLSLVSHKPAEVPESVLSPAPTTDQESGSSDADSVHNETPTFDRNSQEAGFSMVNHTHGHLHGLDQAAMHTDACHNDDDASFAGGEGGDCRLLWEFIYQLLQDRNSRDYVCWEGTATELVFRIVNPTGLAELWGQQKNRSNMTYEKLSRALRYYYKMNIIKKVPGKRLTYKFLQHPTKIQKGQRGAKPHCLRNLPAPTARPLSSSSPAATHQQQQRQQYSASPGSLAHARSPAESLPPSLSPVASLPHDDLPRASSSPLPGSAGRRSSPRSCSFPPTPVHMFPRLAGDGTAAGATGSVCSTLKEHIQLRQLQTKVEPPDDAFDLHDFEPHDRCMQSLRHLARLGGPLGSDDFEFAGPGYQKMDYQDEPEDLSVKPSLVMAASSFSSRCSSTTPSSSSLASSSSPATSSASLSAAFSSKCQTPIAASIMLSCPSSPRKNDGRKEEADDSELALVQTSGVVAITPDPLAHSPDSRSFPVFPENALRPDSLPVVKSEPLPLPAS